MMGMSFCSRGNSGGKAAVEEAQIDIRIEEVLRDRAGRASVQLALEVVQIVGGAECTGMRLRIGRNRDFEVGDMLQARDKVGR